MLSILIPNYNQNVIELVNQLNYQVKENACQAEIIVGDDASENSVFELNRVIEQISEVRVIRHNTQLGRARMRNVLADEAKFDNLLFIDSDALLLNTKFIKNYLNLVHDAKVIIGGVAYQKKEPKNNALLLRWKYGRKKEERFASERNLNPYKSFSTFNFFIEKKTFQSIRFNETLMDYGHEDTLFGYELQKRNIPVLHIDNALLHNGLEEGSVFLEKTRISLASLHYLYQELNFDAAFREQVRILDTAYNLNKFGLVPIAKLKFQIFRNYLEKNLTGRSPSVLFFQMYKLGYYCTIADRI
ncbi:MAG: glycosyltransferase [Bacteroidales bacterium]|nr:glycosyltransferase [Bacteroidales bacterium]